MDQTEVTNHQFAEFVRATGYVTIAEKTPRAQDFPGAPPENLVAGSVVFTPPSHKVPLDSHFRWWTSDWYRHDTYRVRAASGKVIDNPTGPEISFDPSEPRQPKRVMKGGSFLCTSEYCSRYMPGGRGKGDPMTGTDHLGFRCVKDAN